MDVAVKDEGKSETSFEDIERAYRVLSDPQLRTQLDAQLQSSLKQDVIINEQVSLTDFHTDDGKLCLWLRNVMTMNWVKIIRSIG